MSVHQLNQQIVNCQKCPRLRAHCAAIAASKRASFANETYWGKPVPSWGDPLAELVIIGLAPAAHGANRTGRMFTGDRSGEWLYRALYKAGFANQALSHSQTDGLKIKNAWITAIAHCAPPDNKPSPEEIKKCALFLQEELALLQHAKVYLALGQLALSGLWPHLLESQKKPKFSHGGELQLKGGKTLLLSYHPSQQNTFTGRLTQPMFDSIFSRINKILK